MIISVINHTHDQITDSDLHTAIRAINRQIAEDFEPYSSLGRSPVGRQEHHEAYETDPLDVDWRLVVINAGAWQRVVTPDQLEVLKRKKWLNDNEVLTKLSLTDLPECYSVVLVAPYKEKDAPVPLLRYWTKGEHGTWKMSDQCELGNDGR